MTKGTAIMLGLLAFHLLTPIVRVFWRALVDTTIISIQKDLWIAGEKRRAAAAEVVDLEARGFLSPEEAEIVRFGLPRERT